MHYDFILQTLGLFLSISKLLHQLFNRMLCFSLSLLNLNHLSLELLLHVEDILLHC